MSGAIAVSSSESHAGGSKAHDSNERSLKKWAPVLLWALVMFGLSTSYFSAENTSRIIDPILRFLMPGASAATIALGHGVVRKAAHFTNYAILFWLLISGPMRARPYRAFGLCVLYAFLDEGHQMFVPDRTPSLYDVALDSTGALFSRFLHAAVIEIA
ncbi:MAG TPA: VanZ family protein [Candidatus Binataceae bacterium]|nr:VanZ family protein [Candidatus Binataceae bacterium]